MSQKPQELLVRAQEGDQEAFEKLYTEYFTPVYRYLFIRLHSREDAEDLAQSVFLRLVTTKSRYEIREDSLLAYLFTVARNILIDYRRKESHGILYDDETLTDAAERASVDNDHRGDVEDKDAVERALLLLDEVAREVVRLRFIEGMKSHDIAIIIGKSEDAIRQIQSRALKKLRTTLPGML